MLPISPKGDWSEIRTFISLLSHNRATFLMHPSLVILNGGAPNGGARVLANELGRYGFTVSDVANATADGKAPKDADKRDTSIIVPAMPEDQDLVGFFSQLLQIPTAAEAPLTVPREKLGPVTIILGKDYRFRPMTELAPVPAQESDTVTPPTPSLSSSSSSAEAATSASGSGTIAPTL